MFKSQRMVKVGIACPNNLLHKVVNRLYDLKALQIEEYEKGKENGDFDLGHPLKKGEELSELLIKLRSIASHSKISLLTNEFEKSDISLEKIEGDVNNMHLKIKECIEKIDYYKKTNAIIKKKAYKTIVQGIKFESGRVKDKESLLFAGFIKKDVEKEIKTASETSFVVTKDVDAAKLIVILSPKSKKEELELILNKELFVSIDKTEIKAIFPQVLANNAAGNIKSNELSRLIIKEERILDLELRRIKKENENFVLNANKALETELEKCDAPIKFAATKNTHIINGWVPKERYEHIKETLEKETNNKIYVNMIPIKGHETGPILLKNPKPVKSFQFFLDLFSLPSYWEIDPSILLFITFPLYFGFMLGDIGYGVLTLIIFSLMRLKYTTGVLKQILNILIASSVGTIIFGFAFGEIFGEEVIPFFHIEMPHLLSRSTQIMDLLSITIIIGIVHIFFGLILGFINIAKHHDIKHAFMEKVGWMLLLPLISFVMVYLKIVSGKTAEIVNSILPSLLILGIIAMIGVIIIILGEGVRGAIELPGIISNILSYARLMAVGLASVELAIIVNELSKEMFHKGGLMIIVGIIILLVGHTVNLLLGLLGPFLHSLRLHYVEFFGKFYTGGGKVFIPFGEK